MVGFIKAFYMSIITAPPKPVYIRLFLQFSVSKVLLISRENLLTTQVRRKRISNAVLYFVLAKLFETR